MSDKFNKLDYKNIEQLRFYIGRDIKEIKSSMSDSNTEVLGYVIATLVELIIADAVQSICSLINEESSKYIICTIVVEIIVTIVLIFMLSHFARFIQKILSGKKEKITGKANYYDDEFVESQVDKFDNIACDCLLICKGYMDEYDSISEDYMKDFCLYEIVHYLYKAMRVFQVIYDNKEVYINDYGISKIAKYRADNFIEFSKVILGFVNCKAKKYCNKNEIHHIVDELNSHIEKWAL